MCYIPTLAFALTISLQKSTPFSNKIQNRSVQSVIYQPSLTRWRFPFKNQPKSIVWSIVHAMISPTQKRALHKSTQWRVLKIHRARDDNIYSEKIAKQISSLKSSKTAQIRESYTTLTRRRFPSKNQSHSAIEFKTARFRVSYTKLNSRIQRVFYKNHSKTKPKIVLSIYYPPR